MIGFDSKDLYRDNKLNILLLSNLLNYISTNKQVEDPKNLKKDSKE